MFGKKKAKIVEETNVKEEVNIKDREESVIDNKSDEDIEEDTVESSTDTKEDEVLNNKDENEKEEERDLYILIDKMHAKKAKYIKDSGLKIKKIFTDIEEAKKSLIVQYNNYVMVVVDTGTGEFTGIANRDSIIDLIGMVDEDSDIMVFYTDEALRADAKDELDTKSFKKVTWVKYRNTLKLIEKLRLLKEFNCEEKKVTEEEQVNKDDITSIRGFELTENKKKYEKRIKHVERKEISREEVIKLFNTEENKEENVENDEKE